MKRLKTCFLAFATTLLFLAPAFTAEAAEAAGVIASGVYNLKPAHCSSYMDLANSVDADGTNIQLYTPDGTNAQKWMMVYNASDSTYYIRSYRSSQGTNRQLDVYSWSSNPPANGRNIQLWSQGDDVASKWKVIHVSNGKYKIVMNSYPTLAITVANAGTANGTNIQVNTYTGANNQLWEFREVSPTESDDILNNGIYVIKSSTKDYYVEVADAGGHMSKIQEGYMTGDKHQQWKFEHVGSGYYALRPMHNLPYAIRPGDNKAAILYSSAAGNPLANFHWKLIKNADGQTFRFVSKSDPHLVLGVSGTEGTGAALSVSEYTGNSKQHWIITDSFERYINDGDDTTLSWALSLEGIPYPYAVNAYVSISVYETHYSNTYKTVRRVDSSISFQREVDPILVSSYGLNLFEIKVNNTIATPMYVDNSAMIFPPDYHYSRKYALPGSTFSRDASYTVSARGNIWMEPSYYAYQEASFSMTVS
ncbi:MAG: RICIN domain-containing protein [Oscillospiraceae bacterium]|nr:RICIN domain-containing protein [Oscillospiraceae bacterium]